MSWFNVDDGLTDSPELMAIPPRYRMAALGLWTAVGVWMSKQGQLFCPLHVIKKLGGTELLAKELDRCGLLAWEVRDGSGGLAHTARRCRVKDPEAVRKEREATAERVRVHRARQREGPDQPVSDDVTVLHESERKRYASRARNGHGLGIGIDQPDPVQAKPLRESGTVLAASKRGTRLPEDWQPSEPVKDDLRAKYPNLQLGLVLEEFRDYWCGVPGQKGHKLDWDATFRNRVREVSHLPRLQRKAQVNGHTLSTSDQRVASILAMKSTAKPPPRLELM